jgi:hypothetical protein
MATIRQRKAFKEVVRGSTIKDAMIKAKYSLTTANRTNKLTRTKGWQELLDKNLSDEKITAIHNKLLNKRESFIVSDGAKEGSHVEFTEQPHSDAAKAIDMAYKLKKKYESEAINNNIVIVNVSSEGASKYALNPSPVQNS